jgi:site-specific DNA recombinase
MARKKTSEARMRWVLYARVSTDDQNCEMQLRELREYCARREWKIADEYVDAGWSGIKLSRPEFDRLLRDAKQRRFDGVVVWKLDRWGRSMAHCLSSIEELRNLGIRWLAVTQNLDTDERNPMAKLMLSIMAAFAEFEREIIRERTQGGQRAYRRAYEAGEIGKERHSRSGKDLAVGRPRRIFRRDHARELRAKGWSWRRIAKKLNVPFSTVRAAV